VLFRKSPVETTAVPETGSDPAAARPQPSASASAKGRPTPTRKEAELARKQRAKPVPDKRGRSRATRSEAAAERARMRAGMATGDERYFPARDRGPVRAFARDYVDSRRTFGEFMLPAMALFVPITLFVNSIPSVAVRGYVVLTTYVYLILVTGGTAWLGGRVSSQARQRFPGQSTRGVGMYAALRSVQIRRWRIPKPRVRVGEKP
jgi:DUF3043 family protein